MPSSPPLGYMVLDGDEAGVLLATVAVERFLGLASVGLLVAPVVAEDELGVMFQQDRHCLERVGWVLYFMQKSPGGYVRRGSCFAIIPVRVQRTLAWEGVFPDGR